MSSEAVNPHASATVFASAGTGKTWQLVTRLLRLLLNDVEPGAILAVTFTRKAAGEMQERLLQRLEAWAIGPRKELEAGLKQIGLEPAPGLVHTARNLYERVLLSPQSVRTTTFHAFCQDLLGRFPLEAGVAPGFELIEETAEQEAQALQLLMEEANSDPSGALAMALLNLFARFSSMESAKTALRSFLALRSDWWAWTENEESATQMAKSFYAEHFLVDPDITLNELLTPECNDLQRQQIKQYVRLLAQDPKNKTRLALADRLATALADEPAAKDLVDTMRAAFKSSLGESKAFQLSKDFRKVLGETGASDLQNLHKALEQWYDRSDELIRRHSSCQLNTWWVIAGSRLLHHFQAIKKQRRQLDFADLEWLAYRLLNHSADAHLIQYKLDERIDHLLIDEFQDTNPTQWRLILPLLEEFAAGTHDKARTVFLVGDTKQSIYGFRRANPELQERAAKWMEAQLSSHNVEMDTSWRSAKAIMIATNEVFSSGHFKHLMPNFPAHKTHRLELWGRVEILPRATTDSQDLANSQSSIFRNPLTTRRIARPDVHHAEAQQIADRIASLVESRWIIGQGSNRRTIRYGDIYILLHRRTHAPTIEQALQAASIPYAATTKGTLLERLEVKDIRALLTVLHSPQNDLALAQVLRCPIFNATDEHLVTLRRNKGASWWDALAELADTDPLFLTATTHLSNWNQAASTLPLHDLLDQIYFEGNIPARYEAASQPWQKGQVHANLQRLLELALEVDSGRYPSVSRFEEKLRRLATLGKNAPSEPDPIDHQGSVKILTIHEAKGLEAPVVFFSNLGAAGQSDKAGATYVNWPTSEPRPAGLFIRPRREQLDTVTQAEVEAEVARREKERANLVYVAMTRATQLLILTGADSGGKKEKNDLYQQLSKALEPIGARDELGNWSYTEGQIETTSIENHEAEVTIESHRQIPDAMRKVPVLHSEFQEISPSRNDRDTPSIISSSYIKENETNRFEGPTRGSAIHAFIEELASPNALTEKARIHKVSARMNLDPDAPEVQEWLNEASSVVSSFPEVFQGSYIDAMNEIPISYMEDGNQLFGIIDRLLIYPERAVIIDYKTHRVESNEIDQLLMRYRPQITAYAAGIRKIYPRKTICGQLLFTHLRILSELKGI